MTHDTDERLREEHRVIEHREQAVGLHDQDIEVTIVDTDVHPLPVSADVLKSYAPPEWRDTVWPAGNAVAPIPYFYDTPDSYKTNSLRVDAAPPRGGVAGSDPDFAAKQLLIDAGVSIASLEPMCDAQLPQAEHVLKSTYNDWLADVWLGENNWHGRWRGSISISAQVEAIQLNQVCSTSSSAVNRKFCHGNSPLESACPMFTQRCS